MCKGQGGQVAHRKSHLLLDESLTHPVKRAPHLFDWNRHVLSDEDCLAVMCKRALFPGCVEDPGLVSGVMQLNELINHNARPVRSRQTEAPMSSVNLDDAPFGLQVE